MEMKPFSQPLSRVRLPKPFLFSELFSYPLTLLLIGGPLLTIRVYSNNRAIYLEPPPESIQKPDFGLSGFGAQPLS